MKPLRGDRADGYAAGSEFEDRGGGGEIGLIVADQHDSDPDFGQGSKRVPTHLFSESAVECGKWFVEECDRRTSGEESSQ